jgi:ribonuclease HI
MLATRVRPFACLPGSVFRAERKEPSRITGRFSHFVVALQNPVRWAGPPVSRVDSVEVPTEAPVVYTDGACLRNPGPGGWAWAVSPELYASGPEAMTTNQRMELTAVIRALDCFGGRVRVVSDSTYVVNCFRQRWWAGWRAKGWRNARGEPVSNQDLWRPLVALMVDERPGEVELEWVKGHGTCTGNILADRLATEAARLQRGAAAGWTAHHPEHPSPGVPT